MVIIIIVIIVISLFCFFFFMQNPAYELRISYWSSDVCSSDLRPLLVCRPSPPRGGRKLVANQPKSNFDDATGLSPPPCLPLAGRGLRRSPPIERLQLVDQPFDHRQPLRPEGRVGGVEAEGFQEFGMVLAAAGLEEVEILLLEAKRGLLVDRVERVHQDRKSTRLKSSH